MTIITDEQIKKLRASNIAVPQVNESCIWCSACVAISDEVFELNEEGISEVIALENYDDKNVDDSIAACPVDAIIWMK